ncbi:MAG: Nif3-like dinuclear metal center hexameric protein [Bacteroidetes bacterium GWC2_33_15]|nr:MAG: Nif3-like dinuclear metal center hexameric protein [Bacteroidetes bacterium GWA2_33_15]OFX48833.1 MAG: Nif3-like dinuclear metal center hexameric protein [Bacteroidetes bacterium GWC2_33_15]OFX66076.1 MAG: Nif3-like dinuclear metal center hexameric protein [Bacteroidetes bacterium GWB2_32_14]OFX68162.1 MAG: Nif3-like dinuclear metal center hexameric protein [Bacteroidetes bacterium GWD2_33_33]HAN17934.1 Nif3-like dinuclear metal center hexameric protein [Bacteroidales bacterium]
MKIKEVISYLESFAPLSLQEDYDNSGLIIGNPDAELTGILITIDSIEEVVQEAIDKNLNLIISHHPVIFSGLKKINGKNYIEKTVLKAIKNDIAIYAAHTNLDSVSGGVNSKIAQKLNLKNTRILSNSLNQLIKLVYFVPVQQAEETRKAVFEAGAGHIGNYDMCSFNVEGKGTFKARENTNPFVGKKGEIHTENEIRVEVILPKQIKNNVIQALISAHPYEEVAYDLYALENEYTGSGIGIIGELENEMNELDFLNQLKSLFNAKCIRYTGLLDKPIKKAALCGGSGSFLLNRAIAEKADVFISADFKYHQFFDANNKILIADIGHFESEQFTKELIYELLIKKFPKFAVHLSEINSNPINYL